MRRLLEAIELFIAYTARHISIATNKRRKIATNKRRKIAPSKRHKIAATTASSL
jgi:hypothetical protein